MNALISLLERNCNPCQATLYHAHCHLHFKVINIFQDIPRQDERFQKQILEYTDNNYFLSKTKRKRKIDLKQETFRGSLDHANLDLDLNHVRILDLDPSLEIFQLQKCLQ